MSFTNQSGNQKIGKQATIRLRHLHKTTNLFNLEWAHQRKNKVSSLLMQLKQRPDQYTYQVSVYLPSISILIIILSILIFKYWYWYFLFQKRTEILILQYYFYRQYQYFLMILWLCLKVLKLFWCTFIEALWLNAPISASFEL